MQFELDYEISFDHLRSYVRFSQNIKTKQPYKIKKTELNLGKKYLAISIYTN